ncbi:MAG: hypothetical protein AAFX56_06080 [Pseudomonadota bacterium]
MRIRTAAALLLALTGCELCAATEREPFQVTFGIRPLLNQRVAATDHVSFIQEAPNGDIFVAGNGGSVYTDTGNRTKPMVARIDKTGHVVWKRIYDDLQDHDILEFAAKNDDLYLLLKTRIRDMSGRTRETETVSLYRIDGQGDRSNLLGKLEGVQIYATATIADPDLSGFALAGIDAAGRASDDYEAREVRLHGLSLGGDFRRLPLRSGITGLRYLQHAGGDSFVFLEMGTFYTRPGDIVRVGRDGTTSQVIDWTDPQRYPSKLLVHGDRIFLHTDVERSNQARRIGRIAAYSISGEKLWHRDFELPERAHVRGIAGLRSGGLAVSHTYEGNPVITVLGPDGGTVWEKRFRSVKRNASVTGLRELRDGWLALAGATGPGGGAYVSTDTDAMLTVTDRQGSGLGSYGGCLVDADEVERLRAELLDLTGIEVRRNTILMSAAPKPLEELPPLDKPVPADIDCGTLSEKDLLTFLRDAVGKARELDLSKPSARARIHLFLRADDIVGSPGYRVRGWSAEGTVPSLEVEYGSAEDVISFVATDILPYTERGWAAFDHLQSIGSMWIGQDSVTTTHPRDLPFKDVIVAAEKLLAHFEQLSAADRNAFAARFRAKPVVFSPNARKLHVWADSWLFVGSDRLDEAFDYALRTAPRLDAEIRVETQALSESLNLNLHKRPDLDRAEYLAALRDIRAAAEGLSAEGIDTIRTIGVTVTMGGTDEFRSDLRFADSGRSIWMTPPAASGLLEEILANSGRLLEQPVR